MEVETSLEVRRKHTGKVPQVLESTVLDLGVVPLCLCGSLCILYV